MTDNSAASAPTSSARWLAQGLALWLLMACLILTRLGAGAFWDDEANTALFAHNLWHHGDLWAARGPNLIAYSSGIELKELGGKLVNRAMPPLAYVLAAPFVGTLGLSEGAARLPFALCALLTVALLLRWLRRDGADRRLFLLFAVALISHVSLILYARQCRYYAAAMLAATGLAYTYAHWDGRWPRVAIMSLASSLLFGFHYLSMVAVNVCMLVDYALWQRRSRPAGWPFWLAYMLPQLLICGWIWQNFAPPDKPLNLDSFSPDWWSRNLGMFWRSFRDLNRAQFVPLPLLVICPILGWRNRRPALVRLFVSTLVYSATIACLAPEVLSPNVMTPLRHYAPAIALYLMLGVLCLYELTRSIPRLSLPLALMAYLSSLSTGRFLLGEGVQCHLWLYLNELRCPPENNYSLVGDWINAHVAAGSSIWVQPHYACYPLMHRAPKAIYAWQFVRPTGDFNLAPIHQFGARWPDYIIRIGPPTPQMVRVGQLLRQDSGVTYVSVATLGRDWREGLVTARPELWSHFPQDRGHHPYLDGIQVFRRVNWRGLPSAL